MSASAPGSRIARRNSATAGVGAAQLEDLLDDGAVLALEVARAAVDGHVVGVLGDLDAQAALGVGGAGADDAAHLSRRA